MTSDIILELKISASTYLKKYFPTLAAGFDGVGHICLSKISLVYVYIKAGPMSITFISFSVRLVDLVPMSNET